MDALTAGAGAGAGAMAGLFGFRPQKVALGPVVGAAGIYTNYRHEDRGYVSVGFPLPKPRSRPRCCPRHGRVAARP